MARKPASKAEFILFDVVYEDGSQRSNRRVPRQFLDGLDGDVPPWPFLKPRIERLPNARVVRWRRSEPCAGPHNLRQPARPAAAFP